MSTAGTAEPQVAAAPARSRSERDYRPIIGVGTLNVTPRARELVLQTLDQNRLSYGQMSQQFEQRFAQLHGCRFGVFCNSGTSALHIAVAALKELGGWREGDEILVPSVTFVATANVALHNGLTPVFVDVERAYYEIDPASIEARITPRTRAMIPVHLFGQPCEMEPILDIARRHGLKVIEDSCETMFAHHNGRSVGTFGDIGCFSTYVAHLLVTGVGGLCTTNDSEYAVILRSLMNHGRDSIYLSIDDDDNKSAEEMRMIIERRFRFIHAGHSFRATEMEAALGLAQLDTWSSMIAARRRNARFLSSALGRWSDRMQLPAVRPGSEHSFMMYPIVLRDEAKTVLTNHLERYGVETRDMLPLTNQPVYQRMGLLDEAAYPNAAWINANGFYVGCHQDLSDADLEYMVELFDRYWSSGRRSRTAGAALVIVIDDESAETVEALGLVPTDLFTRIVVLRRGPAGPLPFGDETGAEIEQHDIGQADALVYLREQLQGTRAEDVVFFSANGRQNPADIPKVLLQLQRGYDMVIASRFTLGGSRQAREGQLSYRSVGNRFFTALANLAFYGQLTDAISPFFAIRRERLVEADITMRGLPAVYQLAIASMRREWRVSERPTVEQRPPSRAETSRAWKSVLPLTGLLWREWRADTRRRSGRTT